MRVELDGVFYSLPDNDEAASLMSELRAHDISMNVLKYLLNAAGNREMDLWDRIKTMSLEYKKTVT
jgi:hypothetical protein